MKDHSNLPTECIAGTYIQTYCFTYSINTNDTIFSSFLTQYTYIVCIYRVLASTCTPLMKMRCCNRLEVSNFLCSLDSYEELDISRWLEEDLLLPNVCCAAPQLAQAAHLQETFKSHWAPSSNKLHIIKATNRPLSKSSSRKLDLPSQK